MQRRLHLGSPLNLGKPDCVRLICSIFVDCTLFAVRALSGPAFLVSCAAPVLFALVLRLGSPDWRWALESVARGMQTGLAEALSQLSALSQQVSRQASAIDGGESSAQRHCAELDQHSADITNMTCQLQALQHAAQTVAQNHQLLHSLLVTHQQTQLQAATLLQQVAVLQQQVAAQPSATQAAKQVASRVANLEQWVSAASSGGQSLPPGSASGSGQGSRPEVVVLQVGARGPTDL